MNEDDVKAYYLGQLVAVRAKRDSLSSDSPIRQALGDDVLQGVGQQIHETSPENLDYGYVPPLYGFVAHQSADTLAALDNDVKLVTQHTAPEKALGITQFLKTRVGKRHGDWYGGLFDLWAKGTVARSGKPFEFDCALPNGRDNDVCLQMNGRRFHIECTVLSQDDESVDVWKRFLEDCRVDPSKVLIRPGPYCPPNAKGPSPYYETLRFYAKVFDKLTKDLDPSKTQCADDEPNVLLVSFAPGISPDAPSVGWALDELFAAQPKMARTIVPESFTDISLDAWVDFRARELIRNGRMTVDWFCDNSHDVLAAPRRLGAILLFAGCTLNRSRINYNADGVCSITHREMADLEQLFNEESSYWM